MKEFNGPVWEGVYHDFSEARIVGEGFESLTWISRSYSKAKEMIEKSEAEKTVKDTLYYNNTLLPAIAIECIVHQNKVKILDFGGGIGSGYVPLMDGLVENDKVEYVVVEGKNNCDAGKKMFQGDSQIRFYDHLPTLEKIDIVHLGSSIQYIENWKDLLCALSNYNASYFLFTDLPSGDMPTYVSLQKYYDSRIPHWFFNLHEFIGIMEEKEYKLMLSSAYHSNILGKYNFYPQENFSEEKRIGHSKNLVFVRRER